MLDEYRDRGTGTGISGRGTMPLRHIKTFTSFKSPVYRIYYGALLGQMAAMNMQMMARSLLIYRLTGSAAILGAMSLANAIPMLSLSLFGGIIADRVQKKYIMLFGQMGSAIVSVGIALSLTLGYLSSERVGSWWILMVTSVLQGTIMALMMPSRQAIIPEIVGEEQLMNAISLSTMGMNVLQLFAPALTGFLIDALGFEAVYYVMTGLYVMATAFIAFLPRTGTTAVTEGNALANIKQGLKYIRHETNILIILAFSLVIVVLSMPYRMLLPIFTDDILKVGDTPVGATGMGTLMSVSGAGAMAGSLVLASLPNRKRGIMLLTVGGVLMGLALAGFSFSTSWPLSLTLIVFVGLAQTARVTLSNTLLQYYVDPEYRGRVMSLYMMQFGLMSFGTFAAGVLAESMGVQWALGGFAIGLTCLSLLALAFLRRLRKLD